MKKIYTFLLLLTTATCFGKDFKFQFVYGFGLSSTDNCLISYQLQERSGRIDEALYYISITKDAVKTIAVDTRKYTAIIFKGSTGETIKKSILPRKVEITSLSKRDNNTVDLIGATVDTDDLPPLSELIKTSELNRYSELLTKSDASRYRYDNVIPIGRFIIIDPSNPANSKEAFSMPGDLPLFVESSKKVTNRYILKKDASFNFNGNYSTLVRASFNTAKSKFVEYLMNIDTLQILHWGAQKSELQFLNDEINKGNLSFLLDYLNKDSTLKLFFVSSCVKVKGFTLYSQTHDSLGTVADVNVSLSGNPASLTLKAGVVYVAEEGMKTHDHSFQYYTGFSGRDYTTFVKALLNKYDRSQKVANARSAVTVTAQELLESYNDFRRTDSSLIDFSSPSSIQGFVEVLHFKDAITSSDTLNADEKKTITTQNARNLAYNATLKMAKEKVTAYKNAKIYLADLQAGFDGDSEIISKPENVALPDTSVESALKSRTENSVSYAKPLK